MGSRKDTELTGYFKLKLWVEGRRRRTTWICSSPCRRLTRPGELVNFYYITRFHLRDTSRMAGCASRTGSSMRRGARRISPSIPISAKQRLQPGEIVPVEIEIWPSSTLFRAGETMRVVVMGTDPFPPSDAPRAPRSRAIPDTRNAGAAQSSIPAVATTATCWPPVVPTAGLIPV